MRNWPWCAGVGIVLLVLKGVVALAAPPIGIDAASLLADLRTEQPVPEHGISAALGGAAIHSQVEKVLRRREATRRRGIRVRVGADW